MYDGSWRNGTYNGKGRITWNANNNYSGLWKDGLMHDDNGTLNSDEMKINGQFRNGSPNGRVEIRYLTGYKKDDVYEGNAVDGYMTGYGYYHYFDGRKYTGNLFLKTLLVL